MSSQSRTGEEYITVNLESIRPDPNNPFKSDVILNTKMQELMDSIARRGLDSPIKVVPIPEDQINGPEKYQIVFGERRWFACQQLGIESIPVLLELHDSSKSHLYDESILEEQLDENIQNRDILNPLELAVGYRRLLDIKKCDQRELAKELSIVPSKLSRILSINELDDRFKRSIMMRVTEDNIDLPMYPLSFLVQVRQRQLSKSKAPEIAMVDAISFFNASKSHIPNDPRIIPIENTQPIHELEEMASIDIQTHHGKRFHKVIIKHNPNNVIDSTSQKMAKDCPIRITTNQYLDFDTLKLALDKVRDALTKMEKDALESRSPS